MDEPVMKWCTNINQSIKEISFLTDKLIVFTKNKELTDDQKRLIEKSYNSMIKVGIIENDSYEQCLTTSEDEVIDLTKDEVESEPKPKKCIFDCWGRRYLNSHYCKDHYLMFH